MNLAKLLTPARLLAGFFVALSIGAAQAQWQTPNHSIPIGLGASKTGFNFLAPCTAGYFVGGNGSSSDPSCQGFVATGTGATSRPWQDKAREVVSVDDFTGATTAAQFQAAATAACAYTNGARLIATRKSYTLTAPVTIPCSNVTIEGENEGSVQIIRNHDAGYTFSFTTGTTTPVSGVGVRNLSFQNGGTMTYANSPFHLNFDNALRVYVEKVTIHSGAGGVRLAAVASAWIDKAFFAFLDGGTTTNRAGIRIEASSIGGLSTAWGGNIWISNTDIWGGTLSGSTVTASIDTAIDVRAVDGLWLSNVHAFNTALANYRLYFTNASHALSNVYAANTMSDHAKGYGLLIDGTQTVSKLRWEGQFSTIGTNTSGYHGIAVSGGLNDAEFRVSVEGYKANGIYIENANAANIAIYPGSIRNNDYANTGAGGGIWLQRCTRCSVVGGVVGGDTKQDFGIRLGSQVNAAVVSGVTVSDNEGAAVQVDLGATNFVLSGITTRNSGASVDNSGVVTKKIKGVTDLADYPALGVAEGGTGITSYAVGDLIYASGATTLAKLAAVATNNVLISQGVTTAPAWGKVALAALATQAADTVVGNATGSAAAPTAVALLSCSTSSSALQYNTTTHAFACNTAINASTLGGKSIGTSGNTIPLLDGVNTFSGVTTFSDTTDASSTGSGSVKVSGGLGVAKQIFAKALVAVKDINGVGDYAVGALGSSNGNQQVWFGYDTTNNRGFMQALVQGTGYKPFLLNPSGGNVVIGATSDGSAKLDVTGDILASTTIQTGTTTVGSLGTCNAGAKGKRHFVTDANATTFASTVAAGGANNVPVVCNGTNWIIG